jgi:hypothetical protein
VLTIFKLIINLIVFILVVSPVYAISSPSLTSPADKSTVSSNTLTWETTDGASQYHIIVDDESTVTSPYIKNYNTSRNQYSPKLENKTYYWKVSAKDASNNWGSWSPVWSFTLVEASPNPSPQTTPKTPSPKPSPKISPSPPIEAEPSPIESAVILAKFISPSLEPEEADEGSVAGIATTSTPMATTSPLIAETVGKNSVNWLTIIGAIFIGIGGGFAIYLYVKSRK